MSKDEYLESLFEAYNNGHISAEAYEAGLTNMEDFITEDDNY